MGLSILYSWHRFMRACRRIPSCVTREKTQMGSEEIHVQASLCFLSLPWEISHGMYFYPWNENAATCVQCICPGKSIRYLAPKVFPGAWSHMYPLSSTYQDSSLPEGKQEFGISHIVCTNILGTVTYSHLLTGDWGCFDSQVSRCQTKSGHASKPF